MFLENFKGKENNKTVDSLIAWVNEFLYKKDEETKPYAIIHGTSGNGKTFLVECLAKDYKVDLLKFTADDIEGTEDINNIEKSLNLQGIETTNLKKIVFIDDIEDIKNKKRLSTLYETCNYPIIFTTRNIKELNGQFEDALVLEVKKPLASEIKELLEEKAKELNITCDCMEEIAQKSHSVRTALQSLLLGRPIEKNAPVNSISMDLRLIVQRALKGELRYPALIALFRGIKEYDVKSYQLRERLCQLDALWHVEFFKDKERTLPPVFVNSMPNIDIVKLEYKEKEKKVVEKKPKKKKEEVCMAGLELEKKKEVKDENVPSLSSFL